MTHARVVFRNTTVLAGARIIERLTGLLLALIITRNLGASGLGVYATATAYFGLIQSAGESGSTNLLIRELSKDRQRTSSYVVHTSIMALAFSGIVITIASLVIPHLGYGHDLRKSLQLIVLAVAPGTLNTIQEAVFIAYQRVELETISTLVSSVALAVASFALLRSDRGVVSLIAVFVILEYAITIVYFILINRYIARLHFEFRLSVAAEILREMKTFAGSSLIAGLTARPEILFLSFVTTQAAVGYYTGALKIVELFAFVPAVYMTNVFPLLSRSFHMEDGHAQRLQDLSIRYLLAFGLPVTAGLAAASHPIIDTLYGEEFGNAVTLLRILSVNVILFCITAVLWRVLAARGEQGAVLRVQLCAGAARLAGGAGLITLLRALGAAFVPPAFLLLYAALLGRAVRRSGTTIGLVRLCWRFACAAAIMGVVVLGLSRSLPLWGIVLIGMCVYVALVIVFRAFSSEEVAVFRSLLPSLRVQRLG